MLFSCPLLSVAVLVAASKSTALLFLDISPSPVLHHICHFSRLPALMDSHPSSHGSAVAIARGKPDISGSIKGEAGDATQLEARDFLEQVFLPCIQQENSVASVSVRVLGDLVDAACVEVAYECIRLNSIGAFSRSDQVAPASSKLPAVSCPHCGASVGISKFVPHLAACMNIGGRRRARPNATTASTTRDGHMSPSEFDFGSDDDDTAFGSRKKKAGHSTKVKNGETKTYGSKGKSKLVVPSSSSYISESSSHIMSDPFEFL